MKRVIKGMAILFGMMLILVLVLVVLDTNAKLAGPPAGMTMAGSRPCLCLGWKSTMALAGSSQTSFNNT